MDDLRQQISQLKQKLEESELQVARLNEREQSLIAVLNTAADAIITIDQRGKILSANPATERMFGYSQQELIGQNVKIIMPSPYREEHDEYIRRYMDTGEAKIIGIGREVLGQTKDGHVFPTHLAVSEVDHLQIFTGIIRDLTDLHRAQQKLLQSERLAAIGEMVTGLAHESRNALQRTQACLEVLEQEVEHQPDALDLVRRIQAAQGHVHSLYEEVRSYAAPVVIKPEKLQLDEIWREAWAMLSSGTGHVRFRVTQNTQDLSCCADRRAVIQLLRIVFENALAACGADGIVILTVADAAWPKPALEILITDTGPGFTTQQQARVFEPFFTTKTTGTGLGMAIARRLIEAHEGEIDARNHTDPTTNSITGAEVRIILPRETEASGLA